MDHISTYGPYYFFFIRSSGARYHNVTTFRVNGLYGNSTIHHIEQKSLPNSLASPKSAIFKIPFLFSNKFVSFRSLCIIYFEWAQLIYFFI